MVGSFGLSGAIFTADIGSQGPRVAAPDGANNGCGFSGERV
jgi:hypothetical protein